MLTPPALTATQLESVTLAWPQRPVRARRAVNAWWLITGIIGVSLITGFGMVFALVQLAFQVSIGE